MTINNATGNADKLLRISCPVATFVEKRIIDKGEGAQAPRERKTIPVGEHQVLTRTADTPHIMLLETIEKLENGQHFFCSATLSNAGRIEFDVSVQPRGSS